MTLPDPIRILLVDDHPVVLQGVAAIISHQTDMQVVATARTGREAIETYLKFRPDVAIIDLRLPDMNGSDVISTIRQKDGAAGFVVLTVFGGEEDIYRALQTGARAYLQKDATPDELLRAIRAVSRGSRYIPSDIASRLADRIAGSHLTPRELAVLQLMTSGISNKEIAVDLSIGEGTVKTHVNSILRKLGATSRSQAILTAICRGIVRMVRRKEF